MSTNEQRCMQRRDRLRAIAVAFTSAASLALTACGGGGGSGSPSPAPAPAAALSVAAAASTALSERQRGVGGSDADQRYGHAGMVIDRPRIAQCNDWRHRQLLAAECRGRRHRRDGHGHRDGGRTVASGPDRVATGDGAGASLAAHTHAGRHLVGGRLRRWHVPRRRPTVAPSLPASMRRPGTARKRASSRRGSPRPSAARAGSCSARVASWRRVRTRRHGQRRPRWFLQWPARW